jgi:hypothetical protein
MKFFISTLFFLTVGAFLHAVEPDNPSSKFGLKKPDIELKKEIVKSDNSTINSIVAFNQNEISKNKIEFPTYHLIKFVESCTFNFIKSSGMANRFQAKEVGLSMCSCIMDEFRGDFSHDQMIKSGPKIMKMMAPKYSMACGQKMKDAQEKAKLEPTFWVQK